MVFHISQRVNKHLLVSWKVLLYDRESDTMKQLDARVPHDSIVGDNLSYTVSCTPMSSSEMNNAITTDTILIDLD